MTFLKRLAGGKTGFKADFQFSASYGIFLQKTVKNFRFPGVNFSVGFCYLPSDRQVKTLFLTVQVFSAFINFFQLMFRIEFGFGQTGFEPGCVMVQQT